MIKLTKEAIIFHLVHRQEPVSLVSTRSDSLVTTRSSPLFKFRMYGETAVTYQAEKIVLRSVIYVVDITFVTEGTKAIII